MTSKLKFLILITLSAVKADINCQKRPNFNLRDSKDCCNTPEPNWETFFQECYNFMSPFERPPNPCALECIFNTTNALRKAELDSENVRVLLSRLFNDQIFVDAYALGIKKCAPIIKERVAEIRKKGQSFGFKPVGLQTCSPLALVHIMCAHKSVFINCPSTAWNKSAMCASAREYFIKCDRSPGGWGGTKGPRSNAKKGYLMHFLLK